MRGSGSADQGTSTSPDRVRDDDPVCRPRQLDDARHAGHKWSLQQRAPLPTGLLLVHRRVAERRAALAQPGMSPARNDSGPRSSCPGGGTSHPAPSCQRNRASAWPERPSGSRAVVAQDVGRAPRRPRGGSAGHRCRPRRRADLRRSASGRGPVPRALPRRAPGPAAGRSSSVGGSGTLSPRSRVHGPQAGRSSSTYPLSGSIRSERDPSPGGQPGADLGDGRVALPGERQVGRPEVPLGRPTYPDGPARVRQAAPRHAGEWTATEGRGSRRGTRSRCSRGGRRWRRADRARAPCRRRAPDVTQCRGRIDAVPLGHEAQRLHQRVHRRLAGLPRLEVAEQRDPNRAVVVVERVPGHDVLADDLAPTRVVRIAAVPSSYTRLLSISR